MQQNVQTLKGWEKDPRVERKDGLREILREDIKDGEGRSVERKGR